jgi:glycerol kinase
LKVISQYILAIDQGTTGSTAVILDREGRWVGSAENDFPQIFPRSGWVEHNPEDIWNTVVSSIQAVIDKTKIEVKAIATIGITNQRETVIAWDAKTGLPIYNAIVWQCRRTSDLCKGLRDRGKGGLIKRKTGLVLDPYFSASKISWIIKNVPESKSLIEQGRLKVGTVDTFILWRLTNGSSHKTEVSNASRTMLMDLKTLSWDAELLKLFGIPRTILPSIEASAGTFGYTQGLEVLPDGIPVCGILGDQQAALFGQACWHPGKLKCTFGTGSFILLNTGEKLIYSKHGMLTTVAWKFNGKVSYALEGGAFVCGAAVQWLRDGLGIIANSSDIEALAATVEDTGGVEFVPALTGLGAPYWKPDARGVLSGISRGTTKSHIARATLEAMALQNYEIIEAMQKDLGKKIRDLSVDGGATSNNLLMQLQANYLGKKVVRPKINETTVLGAALMAGIGVGFWKNTKELLSLWQEDREFIPSISTTERKLRIGRWQKAIKRAI